MDHRTETNELTQEQLSALMDGELAGSERAFLLRRLGHDAALRSTWSRYHEIRDVLQGRHGEAAWSPSTAADFSARVMARIDQEQIAPTTAAVVPLRSWWQRGTKAALGAAIAASVATVALMSTQSPEIAPRTVLAPMASDQSTLTGNPEPLVPILAPTQRASFGGVSSDPTRELRLGQDYLLQHAGSIGPSPGAASAYIEWVDQQRTQ